MSDVKKKKFNPFSLHNASRNSEWKSEANSISNSVIFHSDKHKGMRTFHTYIVTGLQSYDYFIVCIISHEKQP